MDPLQELCLACRHGDIKTVDDILCNHKNIDINKPGKDGMTPLQEACGSGALEVVKHLIKQGANVTSSSPTDMRGFQALHVAVYNRKQSVVEFLIREGKCSVNTLTSYLETPLHIACLRGDVSMVTFLLGCNANCMLSDANGNTPLHHAAAGNSADIVENILSCRVELKNSTNKFGQTAAHCAAMLGCYKAMEVLVHSGQDLSMKDCDGHTPHDVANFFQNALCFDITRVRRVAPSTKICPTLSSNSFLTVQNPPYIRSSSGVEGDRMSGDGSPRPGMMKRRPSLTGINRPRSINLPFGLLSKKPLYVSGELAENVSRNGSIDWQNVCVEPPADVQFIQPKHHVTLNQNSRQLVSREHGIKLKLRSSNWKQMTEVEVWLCAGIQSGYMCPKGHFVVSPLCFVSCKTTSPCHVSLTLPTAVRIEEKDINLLTVLTAVPSNASLKLDSPQSVGAGSLTPLPNCNLRSQSNGCVQFTCVLSSALLFAVAVCVEEFPSPSLPLKCCLTVVYEMQKDSSHVKGFDLMAFVGMRLPSVTLAITTQMEKADLLREEKVFDLKSKHATLNISINQQQEWNITARDSVEINCSNLCISHDVDEGFSFYPYYPYPRRFFLDPRQPKGSLICAVHILVEEKELCKAVVTPYNPLRETTPDPSYALPNLSSSLPNSTFGSAPTFHISTSEQNIDLLSVPHPSSSQHSERRRGSLTPSSSHSSFGVKEAPIIEEDSKLLESTGSEGFSALLPPRHVSTREPSPNDSDVSRHSDAPLIRPSRTTDV